MLLTGTRLQAPRVTYCLVPLIWPSQALGFVWSEWSGAQTVLKVVQQSSLTKNALARLSG